MSKADMRERSAGLRQRATSIEPGFVMIKDREIPVVAVSFSGDGKDGSGANREFIIWLSNEIPAGGIAKTWCSDADFPQAEVIDFGF